MPGEIFVSMAKEGSTISGLMDSFATSVSYCLQYGVPLKFLVDKYGHVRFVPSDWTGNPQIPYAKSIPDYIFRWLLNTQNMSFGLLHPDANFVRDGTCDGYSYVLGTGGCRVGNPHINLSHTSQQIRRIAGIENVGWLAPDRGEP